MKHYGTNFGCVVSLVTPPPTFVGIPLPNTLRHPPSATRHPPPATRHPPPATRHPPPATHQVLFSAVTTVLFSFVLESAVYNSHVGDMEPPSCRCGPNPIRLEHIPILKTVQLNLGLEHVNLGLEHIPILMSITTSMHIGLGPVCSVMSTICRAQASLPTKELEVIKFTLKTTYVLEYRTHLRPTLQRRR